VTDFKTLMGRLKQPVHWVVIGALFLLLFDMFVRPINAIDVSLLVIMLVAPWVQSLRLESLEAAGVKLVFVKSVEIEAAATKLVDHVEQLPNKGDEVEADLSNLNRQIEEIHAANNAIAALAGGRVGFGDTLWSFPMRSDTPLTLRSDAKGPQR